MVVVASVSVVLVVACWVVDVVVASVAVVLTVAWVVNVEVVASVSVVLVVAWVVDVVASVVVGLDVGCPVGDAVAGDEEGESVPDNPPSLTNVDASQSPEFQLTTIPFPACSIVTRLANSNKHSAELSCSFGPPMYGVTSQLLTQKPKNVTGGAGP